MDNRENAPDDGEDVATRFFALLGQRIAEGLQALGALGHYPKTMTLLLDEEELERTADLCSSLVELRAIDLERDARLEVGKSTSNMDKTMIHVASHIIYGCITPIAKIVQREADLKFSALAEDSAKNRNNQERFIFIAEKLIETFPSIFPDGLSKSIADDFAALRLGGTPRLLVKIGNKHRAQEHHIHALMHIEFRYGRGIKKVDATNIIADAYGINIETLKKWKDRLAQEDGAIKIKCKMAREQGKHFSDIKRIIATKPPGSRSHQRRREQFEREYGDAALQAHAEEYKRLMRTS